MTEDMSFAIELEQGDGCEFKVKIDWPEAPDLLLDSSPPLGNSSGPDAGS